MEPPVKTISWPEILLLIGIAVSILLPRSYLPYGLLITGGGYLFNLVFHSIRLGILPKASFGPATAAGFAFIFGICLLTIPKDPLSALIITIVAALVLQMTWVVWGNRRGGG
jgi:hypothetical protein